ncbi:MAG: hypothetical protein ACTSQS_18195 [Promethearchaeota archaeon]
MNKIKHDYKCDMCGKPAIINLQNYWHKYRIEKNGSFIEEGEWEGESNEFYCEECAKENGYM